MYCTKCGGYVTPESQFCGKCGHVRQAQSKRSIRLPLWGKLLAFAVLAVFSGAGIYHAIYQRLPEVAIAQLDAIRNNEVTMAYFSYTTNDFKEKSQLPEFKEFIKKHPILEQSETHQMSRESINGKEGELEATLIGQDGSKHQVSYLFKLENLQWKIARIAVQGDYFPIENLQDILAIKERISRQLVLFKKEDVVSAYYTIMSSDYQKRTNLSTFQELVDHFPLLKNFKKIDFLEPEAEGQWRVMLEGEDKRGELIFQVCKEKNEWRINQFEFSGLLPEFNMENPQEIIQKQLQAIRGHEIASAYFDFTTREFQKSISLVDFKAFLQKQEPFMHHRQSTVHSVSKGNGKVKAIATLSSLDASDYNVEYELVLEDKVWKINHIK